MSVPPFRPPCPEPLHPFGWPRPDGSTEFRVTQTFDHVNTAISSLPHAALDLGNGHLGSPIYAPAAGTVLAEGWLTWPWSWATDKYDTGNYGGIMAVIDHGDGYISGLAHLERTIVNKGQQVAAGQQIGNLGDTGAAKSAGHCHWDLYKRLPSESTATVDKYLVISHAGRKWRKVDAWPLLAQNYVAPLPNTSISTEDESMLRFGGAAFGVERSVPRYQLIVGANFREGPSTQSKILQPNPTGMPKGTIVPVAYWVDGESLNGQDQWALAFLYVGGYRPGFFHQSVLGAPDPVEAPPADCTDAIAAAVKEATAPISAALTAATTRIANAKKALS